MRATERVKLCPRANRASRVGVLTAAVSVHHTRLDQLEADGDRHGHRDSTRSMRMRSSIRRHERWAPRLVLVVAVVLLSAGRVLTCLGGAFSIGVFGSSAVCSQPPFRVDACLSLLARTIGLF